MLTPPLKWAGGKRWLLPQIRQMYTEARLIDLCAGGLSVSLGLEPNQAVVNDINPHLINFYQQIAAGLSITIPFVYKKETYYQYRTWFNRLTREDPYSSEAAQLFYYLNRSCFNGLCRFNSKGEFNVPFGRYKTVTYATDFSSYTQRFKSWTFSCADFEQVCVQPTDFIYADPPYDKTFTQYSKKDFTWDDQIRLASWLAQHSGPVVVSNQATERIVSLYQDLGFTLTLLDAPRRISSNGDRTPAKEILATKNVDHTCHN